MGRYLIPSMRRFSAQRYWSLNTTPNAAKLRCAYEDAYMPNLEFDLSSSGRGFPANADWLTAYMPLHPDSVILLDEPDAHLEILRQESANLPGHYRNRTATK